MMTFYDFNIGAFWANLPMTIVGIIIGNITIMLLTTLILFLNLVGFLECDADAKNGVKQ